MAHYEVAHLDEIEADRIDAPAGTLDDALDHLRVAIGMSEEFRDAARSDSDLDPIRAEQAFQQLING